MNEYTSFLKTFIYSGEGIIPYLGDVGTLYVKNVVGLWINLKIYFVSDIAILGVGYIETLGYSENGFDALLLQQPVVLCGSVVSQP